ncbi:WbqC family protein [Dinoroseobacter sp. S375]|uniref:WbqC family protein n=1 Tax=Dinoroseobacter sp. S375 TaxID=3415136 RepID=UPI003C7D7B3C
MRVAVMQPYLYPYPLYFHLIASVDLFVLFDCVQFPRRGRIHRAPLPDGGWLTLPLARQPRDTRIADLAFADDAPTLWAERCAALPWLSAEMAETLAAPFAQGVTTYLEGQLRRACTMLGIETPFLRSSTLALPADLRGQDRVMAAARAVEATTYVNLPGGRDLYSPAAFRAQGLGLAFLEPYAGTRVSLLHALSTEPHDALRAERAALPPPEEAP